MSSSWCSDDTAPAGAGRYDRGSGRQWRRTRLERQPEAAARRGVVRRPRVPRTEAGGDAEDPASPGERAVGEILDLVQPAREPERERNEHGEDGEDRQRVGVEPGREGRPA